MPTRSAKTISIAMATYKGGRHIREQLESLARQTIRPDEVVITDDNSPDNTLEAIAAFAAKAPFPVRVEKNTEQLGYRANFMKAASLCRSAIIAFCDQDDVWLPQKLENVLAMFDHNDMLAVYHNANVVDDDMKVFGNLDYKAAPQAINPPQSLDPFLFSLGFTFSFRRVLLTLQEFWPLTVDYNYQDKIEAHDQWFFFLASCLGTIGYIHEPQVLYRQHGGNVFGWSPLGTGLRDKVRNVLKTNVDGLIPREKCSAGRASVLEQAQAKLEAPYHERAVRAAKGYRDLERFYRQRRQMYETGNVLSRFNQLMNLVQQHYYRPRNEWGVGRNAFVRDVVSQTFPWKLH